MAGTRADFEQAEYIRSLWTDQGLDQVKVTPYEVALSFPKPDRSSKVVYALLPVLELGNNPITW